MPARSRITICELSPMTAVWQSVDVPTVSAMDRAVVVKIGM